MALAEQGELHRYRGDLTLAEHAFTGAYEKGWLPQPGLALVLLAKHDIPSAVSMIARAVEQCAQESAALVSLLPAQVEIALAANDREGARQARDRLASVTSVLQTKTAIAALACVNGRLAQHEGDLTAAANHLERGIHAWSDVRDPHRVAWARVRLGEVFQSRGDTQSAKLELRAARVAFEQLGAAPAARYAARLLGDDTPTHATCTYMFTDIVDSTPLLTALGDDAWHSLLRWHHRTATTIFNDHDGRVVKDTGDGFFVAFDDPGLAVDSAVALQRALDQHRQAEGFSPSVRIGLHTGDAIAEHGDYTGRDVVIAARLADAASAGEILVSEDLAQALDAHVRRSQPRSRILKGITEPIQTISVDWQ
jgi:class 3 adenylate cyclase